MVFQAKIKVIKNIELAPKYYKIILASTQIARASLPGQFIEINVADDLKPLLRRPFSIHRVKGSSVEILYEVVGKGSDILSQRKSGEYLDIIGPLGNGFDFNGKANSRIRRQAILVAGGMGVAPLMFLAERLAKIKPLVLIGAKTKSKVLCAQDFRRLGCEVKVATDDGSGGFKGKVTALLENLLLTMNYGPSTIYACGPRPMLEEISRVAQEHKVCAQVSLEEHMACGIGACLGCAVKTKTGFQRVCKDGPVFDAQDIIWQEYS